MHANEQTAHYVERLKVERSGAINLLNKKIHALAERQRQPYAGRAFKEVLRQCEQFGVDHRCYFNATPLMMAAQCGNTALVEALLERGADPALRDHYGHGAWDYALMRVLDDPAHTHANLDALFTLLSPPVLDVQTGGRLIRLERHQGEYWVLGLMLASFKTMYSQAIVGQSVQRNLTGFCADFLMRGIERIPDNVLSAARKRRVYFNGVLARAEVHSVYKPSRRLWRRTRNGYYTFSSDLKLPVSGTAEWLSWEQWLNRPLVYAGCGIRAAALPDQ